MRAMLISRAGSWYILEMFLDGGGLPKPVCSMYTKGPAGLSPGPAVPPSTTGHCRGLGHFDPLCWNSAVQVFFFLFFFFLDVPLEGAHMSPEHTLTYYGMEKMSWNAKESSLWSTLMTGIPLCLVLSSVSTPETVLGTSTRNWSNQGFCISV